MMPCKCLVSCVVLQQCESHIDLMRRFLGGISMLFQGVCMQLDIESKDHKRGSADFDFAHQYRVIAAESPSSTVC